MLCGYTRNFAMSESLEFKAREPQGKGKSRRGEGKKVERKRMLKGQRKEQKESYHSFM